MRRSWATPGSRSTISPSSAPGRASPPGPGRTARRPMSSWAYHASFSPPASSGPSASRSAVSTIRRRPRRASAAVRSAACSKAANQRVPSKRRRATVRWSTVGPGWSRGASTGSTVPGARRPSGSSVRISRRTSPLRAWAGPMTATVRSTEQTYRVSSRFPTGPPRSCACPRPRREPAARRSGSSPGARTPGPAGDRAPSDECRTRSNPPIGGPLTRGRCRRRRPAPGRRRGLRRRCAALGPYGPSGR